MRSACAMRRKSEEAVTPVIATILMVAITVVLAATVYALIGVIVPPELPKYVSANVDENQNNRTVEILSVQNGRLTTDDVLILVRKADFSTGLNSTLVSEMTPGAYYNGVRFIEGSSEGYLSAGDSFTLDRDIYGSGSEIVFTSADGQTTLGKYTV